MSMIWNGFSYPMLWISITVGTIIVTVSLLDTQKAIDLEHFAAVMGNGLTDLSRHAVWGFVMAIVHEMAGLFAAAWGAAETRALVPDIQDRVLPSALLVVAFVVLLLQHGSMSTSSTPWFLHSSPYGRAVFTIEYAHWLVNVPLLMTLSGYCGLGRPLKEITRPLILTNVYIVFCWAAYVIHNVFIRWALVIISYVMFAWASVDMVQWTVDFERTAPQDLSCRRLRPFIAKGLVFVFCLYGIVWMLGFLEWISVDLENKVLFGMDIGAKLAMSSAFVIIRGSEYHKTILALLRKVSTSNVALVSILRGSFDMVLPCTALDNGLCILPKANVADMDRLQACLGRPVSGISVNELLADREEARFLAYVQNTLRQANRNKPLKGVSCDVMHVVATNLPPIAQVLSCRMKVCGDDSPAACINVDIHLSVVPHTTLSSSQKHNMIIGLRVIDDLYGCSTEHKGAQFNTFQVTEGNDWDSECGDECDEEETRSQTNTASLANRVQMMSRNLQDVGVSGLAETMKKLLTEDTCSSVGTRSKSNYPQPSPAADLFLDQVGFDIWNPPETISRLTTMDPPYTPQTSSSPSVHDSHERANRQTKEGMKRCSKASSGSSSTKLTIEVNRSGLVFAAAATTIGALAMLRRR